MCWIAERVEVGPDRGEVRRAGVAQAVGDARRGRVQLGHRRVLRVEQPQDVALEAVPLELAAGGRRGAGSSAVSSAM